MTVSRLFLLTRWADSSTAYHGLAGRETTFSTRSALRWPGKLCRDKIRRRLVPGRSCGTILMDALTCYRLRGVFPSTAMRFASDGNRKTMPGFRASGLLS